jgi:hypothetical protein
MWFSRLRHYSDLAHAKERRASASPWVFPQGPGATWDGPLPLNVMPDLSGNYTLSGFV